MAHEENSAAAAAHPEEGATGNLNQTKQAVRQKPLPDGASGFWVRGGEDAPAKLNCTSAGSNFPSIFACTSAAVLVYRMVGIEVLDAFT